MPEGTMVNQKNPTLDGSFLPLCLRKACSLWQRKDSSICFLFFSEPVTVVRGWSGAEMALLLPETGVNGKQEPGKAKSAMVPASRTALILFVSWVEINLTSNAIKRKNGRNVIHSANLPWRSSPKLYSSPPFRVHFKTERLQEPHVVYLIAPTSYPFTRQWITYLPSSCYHL